MLYAHHFGHDYHHMRPLKMFPNNANHQKLIMSKAQHFLTKSVCDGSHTLNLRSLIISPCIP